MTLCGRGHKLSVIRMCFAYLLCIQVSCRGTSVTFLYQDIGDANGVFSGDTSGFVERCLLPMSPLIHVSASRSSNGPMMLRAGR